MKNFFKKPIVFIISAVLVVAIGVGIAYAAITSGQSASVAESEAPVTEAPNSIIADAKTFEANYTLTSEAVTSADLVTSTAVSDGAVSSPQQAAPPMEPIVSYSPQIDSQTSEETDEKHYKHYNSFYYLTKLSEEEVLRISADMLEYEVFEQLGQTHIVNYHKNIDIKAYYLTHSNKLIEINCSDINAKIGKSGADLLNNAYQLKTTDQVELKEETFDFKWSEDRIEEVTVKQQLWTCIDGMYFQYSVEPTRSRNISLFHAYYNDDSIFTEDGTPASKDDVKTGTQVLGTSYISMTSFPQQMVTEKIVILK